MWKKNSRSLEKKSDSVLKDILESVPKRFAKFVPMIAKKLHAHGYAWNEEGELSKNGIPFKNIRIVDFFLYLFRNVK